MNITRRHVRDYINLRKKGQEVKSKSANQRPYQWEMVNECLLFPYRNPNFFICWVISLPPGSPPRAPYPHTYKLIFPSHVAAPSLDPAFPICSSFLTIWHIISTCHSRIPIPLAYKIANGRRRRSSCKTAEQGEFLSQPPDFLQISLMC